MRENNPDTGNTRINSPITPRRVADPPESLSQKHGLAQSSGHLTHYIEEDRGTSGAASPALLVGSPGTAAKAGGRVQSQLWPSQPHIWLSSPKSSAHPSWYRNGTHTHKPGADKKAEALQREAPCSRSLHRKKAELDPTPV